MKNAVSYKRELTVSHKDCKHMFANVFLSLGETAQHYLPNTIVCFCVISPGQSRHAAIRTRTMMFH